LFLRKLLAISFYDFLNNKDVFRIWKKSYARFKKHGYDGMLSRLNKEYISYQIKLLKEILNEKQGVKMEKINMQDLLTNLNIKFFGLDFRGREVVIYFYGTDKNVYQLEQWMPIFEKLNKKFGVLFIFRNESAYKFFTSKYFFQAVHLPNLNDLITFYKLNNFRVVLYVNNGVKNFQSLMCAKMFHVHINHGESEKESMHSNQSKAYDYVFVVGDRAIERYKEYLINFDENKYIKVGRPQLDFIEPIDIEFSNDAKTILYAPTWEATHQSMNYTSVDKVGELLIQYLIDMNYNIIYKPHAGVGTKDKNVKKSHEKIIEMLESYENGKVFLDGNINDIFPKIDFAFFDNSSVMIDYLYFNKPGAFIEVQDDPSTRYLKKAYHTITPKKVVEFLVSLDETITNDTLKDERRKIKEFYLGNFEKGESTKKFLEEIENLISKHKQIKDKVWVEND